MSATRRTTIEFPDVDFKWKLKETAYRNRMSMNAYILQALNEKMEKESRKAAVIQGEAANEK